MPVTYESIASTTLGSTQSTISFSNIPQTYNDLVVVLHGRSSSTSSSALVAIECNGVTDTAFYSSLRLQVNTAASCQQITTVARVGRVPSATDTSSTFGHVIVNIFSYSANNVKKTMLSEYTEPTEEIGAGVSLYDSISPITSLLLRPQSGSWVAGTSVTLYGIKRF